MNTTQQGSDTLFGGANADGTGSNLTVHVTQSYTVAQNLDSNGCRSFNSRVARLFMSTTSSSISTERKPLFDDAVKF